MTRIVLDSDALTKLSQLAEAAEICDESGRVIGMFSPYVDLSNYEVIDPPSEEELDRISQNLDGRPLNDILHDLERQS